MSGTGPTAGEPASGDKPQNCRDPLLVLVHFILIFPSRMNLPRCGGAFLWWQRTTGGDGVQKSNAKWPARTHSVPAGRLGVCNTPSSPVLVIWFTCSGACLSLARLSARGPTVCSLESRTRIRRDRDRHLIDEILHEPAISTLKLKTNRPPERRDHSQFGLRWAATNKCLAQSNKSPDCNGR